MPATVHFATNRVLDGPADDVASYSESVVAPSNPNEVTYGTAFVDDANLTADTIGAITSIQTIGKGQFSQSAIDDLSDPGRNLLVFIHGFDNSFENAITRAAFNQQWFAASGLQQAETSVVAFSWPSRGKLISLPFPSAAYRHDQTAAGQSGLHLMTFFANLELRFPIIDVMATPIGLLGPVRGTLFGGVGSAKLPGQPYQFATSEPGVSYVRDPVFGEPVSGYHLVDGRASYGLGLQFFFLGYPLHFDWTKLTDLKVATPGWRFDFWIGYDF